MFKRKLAAHEVPSFEPIEFGFKREAIETTPPQSTSEWREYRGGIWFLHLGLNIPVPLRLIRFLSPQKPAVTKPEEC